MRTYIDIYFISGKPFDASSGGSRSRGCELSASGSFSKTARANSAHARRRRFPSSPAHDRANDYPTLCLFSPSYSMRCYTLRGLCSSELCSRWGLWLWLLCDVTRCIFFWSFLSWALRYTLGKIWIIFSDFYKFDIFFTKNPFWVEMTVLRIIQSEFDNYIAKHKVYNCIK